MSTEEYPNPFAHLITPDLQLTEEGKRELILAQLRSALNGNEALLKHLGFNFLDQSGGQTTIKVQPLPFEDLSKEDLIRKLKLLTDSELVAVGHEVPQLVGLNTTHERSDPSTSTKKETDQS